MWTSRSAVKERQQCLQQQEERGQHLKRYRNTVSHTQNLVSAISRHSISLESSRGDVQDDVHNIIQEKKYLQAQ